MRPIKTTFGLIKILYAVVRSFKDAIRIHDNKTTAIVDVVANDIGRYIIPIINAKIKIGGIFSKKCSVDFLFWLAIKSKHPDAISQNLVGIRKYAAG